jgi:hypothetical protein
MDTAARRNASGRQKKSSRPKRPAKRPPTYSGSRWSRRFSYVANAAARPVLFVISYLLIAVASHVAAVALGFDCLNAWTIAKLSLALQLSSASPECLKVLMAILKVLKT